MGASTRKPAETSSVEEKLAEGFYDRALEDFQLQMAEAAATLRRVHAAMKAENTLRS